MLWRALERVIPDVRERAELCLVGSPLTHERYLNRHRGTYGPAISAADGSFPGPQTEIPGLFRSLQFPSVIRPLTAKAAKVLVPDIADMHPSSIDVLSPSQPEAVCQSSQPLASLQQDILPMTLLRRHAGAATQPCLELECQLQPQAA